MRYLTALLLSAITFTAVAQSPARKLGAVKTDTPPKIDGILDDKAWQNVPIATDFIELQPNAGLHENPENRTEVKFIYDNDAIYIAARMYESDPSKIAREFATRDNVGTADFVGIILDTYKDGINGSGFFVTSTNGQFDAKYAPNPTGNIEDPTWNAVWTSQAKIDDKGWTAEMRIPYSALRFAKKDVQTWGMNLIRKRVNEQKQLWWNEIDPKKTGLINQEGEVSGLEKIVPPVRLAFYPYFSTYLNHYPYNTAGVPNTRVSVNGGMDVKYGINESFTLDLTLIPDFGQVQSDNKILNLTPFEVKYNENRSFFTEGTELFNKGNLFYSRRVGGQPLHHDDIALNDGETIISNPTETKLINAIKFSGRTSKGLGIGVFNGITNTAYATIEDVNGNHRVVQTSPLTNYNIIVLDQNLKNNSAVSLINTNVNRFGKDYSADVGGFAFNLNNKKNSYNLSGFAFLSNKFYPTASQTPNQSGYSYEVSAGKTSGNFTWNLMQDLVSDNYDPNDLGYYTNPNYIDNQLNMQYAQYKPMWIFTQWGVWTNTYYSVRYKASSYQAFNQNFGTFANFKNNWYANINGHVRLNSTDFYEAQSYYLDPFQIRNTQPFRRGETFILNWNLRTNQGKKLWGGFWLGNQWINRFGGNGTDLELFYTYRVNNRFSFGSDVTISPRNNNTGFATLYDDGIANHNPISIIGLRDVRTVDNIFNVKYTFSNIMGLTFRLRHYWSKVKYKAFFGLTPEGDLTIPSTNKFDHDVDQNYNIWNIDMIYVWQFSPGSEISLAWKQSAQQYSNIANQDYYYNFKDTYNQPQNNNFSVKILYYIDYQSLRKKKK